MAENATGREPANAGLQWRQMRALLRVHFREVSRKGVDLSTGAKGNPLLQLSLSLGMIGALSLMALWRMEPLAFVHQVFASTWLLVALTILPESLKAREHKREILASHPVSRRTHAVVQVQHLVMLALIVSFAYATLPLAAVWLTTDLVGAPGFLALLVALVAGCFAVTGLWLPVSLRIGRRLGIERLRLFTQVLLMLFIFGTVLAGFGTRGYLPVDVARWLPSTWFVDLARGAPREWWQVVVVLLLPVAAAVSGYRLNADVFYEEEGGRRHATGGKSLAQRLLDACRRIPGVGPRWLPRASHGVADLVLRVTGREEASQLRGLLAWLLAVIGGVFGLAEPAGAVMVVSALGVALVEGMIAAGQSTDAAAAWLFQVAPVAARHRVAGVRWAVLSRYAAFPVLVLVLLAFRHLPWPAALLLTLGLPVVVNTLLSVALLVLPVPPLAEPPSVNALRGCLVMPIMIFGLTLTLLPLIGLTYLGPIGLAIGAFLLLVAGGFGALASHGAAQRLASR